MNLTAEQLSALENGAPVPCVLDRTECVILRKDVFERMRLLAYDDGDWTMEEMRAIAARTFGVERTPDGTSSLGGSAVSGAC